ncbi:MAG TPA: Gfo/Idh/MocA family oxidoreductase [Chloroflexi bacterium]|nr:Gfo/Idh/MocA family oxidoreductase [Chloroflexota bacterium]
MHGLRAAVAGTGFMGTTHIEALRRMHVEVTGLLGSTLDKGRQAASRLNVPRVYASFDDLVADPEVDVVHICTPNHLHYSMVKAALEHGKHVICEKPVTRTSRESADLVRLARRAGVVVAVNYNLRYYPLCHEARARIQAGHIGKVWLVHGGYLQDWLVLPTDWNWRIDPDLGGELRAVADIGTHWMDMVTWLTGLRIDAVLAELTTFIPRRMRMRRSVETFAGKLIHSEEAQETEVRTEDCAIILLRFDNGARGVLTVSQVSAGRKNRLWWEISGSNASISWNQERPNELWIGYRERPNEVLIKDPALMDAGARAVAGYPGGHAEGYPDTFLRLFEDVYGYISARDFSKTPTFPTLEDGHRQMVLCEAVLVSARSGTWVDVQA